MSRQPRLVLIVQGFITPLGTVAFTAMGIWWLSRGQGHLALVAFCVAGLGPLAILVYYILYFLVARIDRQRVTRKRIALSTDGDTALRLGAQVLRVIAANREPDVDTQRLIVSTLLSTGRRTLGERLTLVVHPGLSETIIEVESFSVFPLALDYGKNHANVDLFVRTLISLASSPSGQDEWELGK
jgi:hypothetical protein